MGQIYHFVRVNGDTGHNDPGKPKCYMKDEPPRWPDKFFNYADYCLANGIVRIGWPDVGDLSRVIDVPDRTPCYGVLTERVRRYLRNFKYMEPCDGVLMPDKDRPGVLYAGTVTSPYTYSYDVPRHPYECAHRTGVEWDRQGSVPIEYDAGEFGISIHGGWWLWAYHKLAGRRYESLVRRIDELRTRRIKFS